MQRPYSTTATCDTEDSFWETKILELLVNPAPWMELTNIAVPQAVLKQIPVGPTLVLGLGGSALGARAALEMAREGGHFVDDVRILDTLDVRIVRDSLEWAQSSGAALQVISKSGSTVEVLALLRACQARSIGPVVSVSDPRDPMKPTAIAECLQSDSYNKSTQHLYLDMPKDVGGRYSVFTGVGQLPLHSAGIPADALLRGAQTGLEALKKEPHVRQLLAESLTWRVRHPAAINIFWCYSESLVAWVMWLQQLECESLGRVQDGRRLGEMLTVLRGPADQHSVAQLILDGPRNKRLTFLDFGAHHEQPDVNLSEVDRLRKIEGGACYQAMLDQGVPSRSWSITDSSLGNLGVLMLHSMLETVLIADHQGLNPYGQPAVEGIKRRIRASLEQ